MYRKTLANLECKHYLHRDICWPQQVFQGPWQAKQHCQSHPTQYDLFSGNQLL